MHYRWRMCVENERVLVVTSDEVMRFAGATVGRDAAVNMTDEVVWRITRERVCSKPRKAI